MLDVPLQASPDSLTYKVCGPGSGRVSAILLVTVGRALTKSLELVALATPTPMPPSILSSQGIYRSGPGKGFQDEGVGVGQMVGAVESRETSDEFHPRLEAAGMRGGTEIAECVRRMYSFRSPATA